MPLVDYICCRRQSSASPPRHSAPNCTAEFDLLLLGTDGSGKSTFLRQMKIIHGQGFTDDELAEFRPDVYRNLTDAMSILVLQTDRLRLPLGEGLEEEGAIAGDPHQPWGSRLAAVRLLWEDGSIQETYRRRQEFSTTHPINVSAKYFLDMVERIAEPNYLPVTEDIVRMRRSTEGVSTHDFHVPGNGRNEEYLFRVTDVGGQAMERQRWFEIIEALSKNAICMIFLAAVDEFDTYVVLEDKERNRLQESAEIFTQLRGLQWIPRETGFILFLNKVDVFKEKIKPTNIEHPASNIIDHFDSFQGFPRDYESGIQFLQGLYVPDRRRERLRNQIFPHFTCATDTNQMRGIFSNVKERILSIYLESVGMPF